MGTKLLACAIIALSMTSCSVDYSDDMVGVPSPVVGPQGGIVSYVSVPTKRSRDFHASLGGDHVIETRKGDRYVHSQTQSFRDGVTGATTIAATRASARTAVAAEATNQVELKEGTKRVISNNKTTEALAETAAGVTIATQKPE